MAIGQKRKATFTPRAPVKKRKVNFTKRVKAIVNRQIETKDFEAGFVPGNLSANVPRTDMPLYRIPQGTTDHTRIGDEFNLSGINWRINVRGSILADTNLVFAMVWTKDQPSANGTSLPYTALFKSVTGNISIDQFDTERCKLLVCKKVRITPLNTTRDANGALINNSTNRNFKLWYNAKGRKYRYDENFQGKSGTIHLVVAADRTSSSTDPISSLFVETAFTVYFKDA